MQGKRELSTHLWPGWCFGKTCSWRNWPNRFLREVAFRHNGKPGLNSQHLTFIIWFIFLCLSVLPACLSVHHMGVSRPEESQISWHYNYRVISCLWVLGTDLRSYGRAANYSCIRLFSEIPKNSVKLELTNWIKSSPTY